MSEKGKVKSNNPSHLNIADLWVVVSRSDFCDDRQRLKITGQTQAAARSQNLQGVVTATKAAKV